MPEFDVNIRGLNANKAKIKTLGGKAVFSKASLDSVAAGLQGCISPSGYAGIKKSLDDASESLKNQIEHLGKLSSGIKQAADTYLKTENAILGTLAEAKYQKPESAKSVWDRILSGETVSGALLGGELSGSVGLFGTVASGSIGGSVLGYEVGGKTVFGVKKKDGKIDSVGISAEGSAKGYVAKGHANAKIGDYEASIEGTVLSAEATGAIGASLYKDGKLSPQIVAEAGIKGSVLSGKAEMKHGNDTFNEHSEAKGEVLGGEAKAEAGVGVITVKNSDGKEVTAIGAKAEAGAEAYVAKGEISRGFTIFGVNIDVGVEGKAAAVGAKAGGSITTGGIQGEIGASLGLGVGINFSIDWSGFRLPWQ